jgi:CubicO group peptidase (beta-lactamase class C family)
MSKFLWLVSIGLGLLLPSTSLPSDQLLRAKYQGLLDPLVDDGKIPAYYMAVVEAGQLLFERGHGSTGANAHPEPTSQTPFALLSLSKPITTLAALKLVDDGAIKLSDRLSQYLPEFSDPVLLSGDKSNKPILISDLFTHTAGLGYGEISGIRASNENPLDGKGILAVKTIIGVAGGSRSLEEEVLKIAEAPLISEPGSEFNYSVSIDILGRVAEVVSGMPLEQYLKKVLLDPLDMTSTGFRVPEKVSAPQARLVKPLIRTYPTPGRYQRYEPFPDFPKGFNRIGEQSYVSSGGSGLVSTPSDMLRFLDFLINETRLPDGRFFLKSELREKIFSNQLNPSIGEMPLRGKLPYAARDGLSFGFAVRTASSDISDTEKSGDHFIYWSGFSSSAIWIDREAKVGGIFLSQLAPSDLFLAERLAQIADENLSQKK